MLRKKMSSMSSGIRITNNETQYIIRVITSLENKGTILNGTVWTIISQERRLLNFVVPLIKVC